MNHNLAPSFGSTTQTHIPRLDGARGAPVPPRICEFFSEHAHTHAHTQTEEHGVESGNRSPRSENEHHHARGHPQSIHPSV